MRRVCGFDALSAHLVRKSFSLSLSVALGVFPMATAFGREDDRTSYSANNRYQDYQNQYKPEKNYSASSQLDRQIRMQNTALALRFQAPTATSLGRMDAPKPTFQTPTIKFDFLGNNAPKIPNALRATPQPEALTAPIKPGLLNTIGNALKAVGHAMAYPFQKIGQGIAGLIQRAFGSGNRATTLTDSQRVTLSAYRNIQPAGDGTFKAAGQTVAFGRTWEEGATFKVEGDQLRLIQGTSFEKTFGGMERKDGGLMPLKMAEVNGVIQPTGLDFDRLAPNTVLTIKSPVAIEGFGELKAGEMTYQGAWKSPDGQTTGGRFKFENTLLDLNKDLAHGIDMNNPVALRQATFALQAGLMRLNSAVVEKGAGKYFVSQEESPVNVARLEKTAGELDKGSEGGLRAVETTKQDMAHRTEALGASAKALAERTGQGGAVNIDMNGRLGDLEKEALAVRAEANRIGQALKAGDYAGLDTATKNLAQRQDALAKKTEDLAGQAAAIKDLQKGFRGMELGAKALSQKAEGQVAAQESENLEASAQIAIAAAKVLVGQGAITPEQGAQLGTQITALRNQVLGAGPAATIKPEETAAHEKQGFFDRMLQKASDLKTGVANRCQETAAKAAGAATAAKALVTDTANETAAWTMTVTQSAAAKTAGVALSTKENISDSSKKAIGWIESITERAEKNTANHLLRLPSATRTVSAFIEERVGAGVIAVKRKGVNGIQQTAALAFAAGDLVVSPLTGSEINRDPMPGYKAIRQENILGIPDEKGIELFGAPSTRRAGNSEAVIFDIRHFYRTPPLVNVMPHSPWIKLDKGDQSKNIRVCFNEAPADYITDVKSSKSINLFVHGFNVTSAESLAFREKMTRGMNYAGYKNLNALISWSGDVGGNYISKAVYYSRAVRSADLSWQGVRRIGQFVKSYNPEIKMNAMTHSLGARLILEAAASGMKFHMVIMLVPALDNEVFSRGGFYEKAIQNIDHLVVVYSKNQEAVFGIYRLSQFDRAMGDVGPSGPVNHPDFKAIDATKASRNQYGIRIDSHSDIYERETIRMMIEQLRRDQ